MTDRRVLRRTQVTTVLLGALVVVALVFFSHRQLAAGLAVGSLLAALNLRFLEGFLDAVIVPDGRSRSVLRISIWFLLKMSVYVVAVWLLIVAPFPVVGMVHGLTVMLAALVLSGLTTRTTDKTNAPQRGDDAHA